MATATKNTAKPTATATAPAPATDKVASKFASQKSLMEAMNSATSSPWISGVPFSTYTDCYDSATGEIKTFYTAGSYEPRVEGEPRKLKAEGERKIAGRIVLDKLNKEVKLYNGFIGLLSPVESGVKSVDVTHNGETIKFTEIKGAQFGIHAVETSVDSNQDKPDGSGKYKVIKHLLKRTADEAKPTAAQAEAA